MTDAAAATKTKVLPSTPAINIAKFGDESLRHHAANLALILCQSAMGFLPNIPEDLRSLQLLRRNQRHLSRPLRQLL